MDQFSWTIVWLGLLDLANELHRSFDFLCRYFGPLVSDICLLDLANSMFFGNMYSSCACTVVVFVSEFEDSVHNFAMGSEHYWSFTEKSSVKQIMKCKVCSNFQMSFLHLRQMDPQ